METFMSVNRDGSVYAAINSGRQLQLGIPANNNLPVREIEASIRSHSEDIKAGRRSKRQTKLWEGFTDAQLRAAQKIVGGFHLLFGRSGLRTQSFDGMPRTEGYREGNSSDLDDAFSSWAKHIFDQRVSVSAVLDIVVFGKSFREVDQAHCKRKGFAKENLTKALDMYLQLRSNTL